jgi:hypothetical protein
MGMENHCYRDGGLINVLLFYRKRTDIDSLQRVITQRIKTSPMMRKASSGFVVLCDTYDTQNLETPQYFYCFYSEIDYSSVI